MDSLNHVITPGFNDPIFDSIKVFRAMTDAMSNPGSIQHLVARPPGLNSLMPAMVAICLTLLDHETKLWIQEPLSSESEYLKFHCNCPMTVETRLATFALIKDVSRLPCIECFNTGDPEYPDRSATLLVQVSGFSNHRGMRLTGPGILGHQLLEVEGLSLAHWTQIQESRSHFPCGLDIIFICGEKISALPRSTQVVI